MSGRVFVDTLAIILHVVIQPISEMERQWIIVTTTCKLNQRCATKAIETLGTMNVDAAAAEPAKHHNIGDDGNLPTRAIKGKSDIRANSTATLATIQGKALRTHVFDSRLNQTLCGISAADFPAMSTQRKMAALTNCRICKEKLSA